MLRQILGLLTDRLHGIDLKTVSNYVNRPIIGPNSTNRFGIVRFLAIIAVMDRFDAAILTVLQRNSRQTAEAMSQEVGLSPDACRKRLARLRASDVIEAEIAILDPTQIGRGLLLIVEVSLNRERKADLEYFKARMRAAPEVMQCYYVTGNADFILVVSARDMADFENFTSEYFFEEENVLRFRTSAVMNRVKTGFSMPVEAKS